MSHEAIFLAICNAMAFLSILIIHYYSLLFIIIHYYQLLLIIIINIFYWLLSIYYYLLSIYFFFILYFFISSSFPFLFLSFLILFISFRLPTVSWLESSFRSFRKTSFTWPNRRNLFRISFEVKTLSFRPPWWCKATESKFLVNFLVVSSLVKLDRLWTSRTGVNIVDEREHCGRTRTSCMDEREHCGRTWTLWTNVNIVDEREHCGRPWTSWTNRNIKEICRKKNSRRSTTRKYLGPAHIPENLQGKTYRLQSLHAYEQACCKFLAKVRAKRGSQSPCFLADLHSGGKRSMHLCSPLKEEYYIFRRKITK